MTPPQAPGPTLTLVRRAGVETLRLPALRARLVRRGHADLERPLGLSPLTVGSGPECDLAADDPYLSRQHCRLTLTERGVVVRDLDSRNGTFVRDVRVLEAVLPDGAAVVVGQATLTVGAAGAPVELPLSSAPRFGDAIGQSPAMRALFARLELAAASDEPVLLLGESGTGKELLAQAVHQASGRRAGPFVVFDCGAVAPTLVESELFGHEKGAFSGAQAAREGLVESADGGTLFLDEVGELPLDLQPRLLRALDRRLVRRVGANRFRPVDVRFVAATHRDLRARVGAGAFREDLYYRLAVVEARVPPLRERPDDLPLLAAELLARRSPPRSLDDLPPGALDMLRAHAWPGNVRELRNVLARLVLFRAAGDPALPSGLAPAPPAAPEAPALPFHEARAAVLADFERQYVAGRLRAHAGNVSAAARAAGVSRQFLHKLMREHGLRDDE